MSVMKVYHHQVRFFLLVPQYGFPLLYLSNNVEVKLMVTFKPVDVIRVVCLVTWRWDGLSKK